MIATPDFWVGIIINIPFIMMLNHYCSRSKYTSSTGTAIVLLILCIVFGLFKNKLIPRKWRVPLTMPVDLFWVVLSSILMAIFILLYATLEYNVRLETIMRDVLPVAWLFGLLLMIVSNSARVPWMVATNLCLLGLLIYNVTDDGANGDKSHAGIDTDYDANLPDDSIWANFTANTPTVDATPDIGITDFGYMAPGSDFTVATVSDFTPLDTWGAFDLANTSFATGVPQFANDPYMALSTGANFNDNFQICDANGVPELTISDGNIFNSENVITGHINYDPTLHLTTYTDAANMPYMRVDQANNIYSVDNCYMGHYTDSGNIRTVFDSNGSVAYRIDKLTNTIYEGKLSSIIGKIKKS